MEFNLYYLPFKKLTLAQRQHRLDDLDELFAQIDAKLPIYTSDATALSNEDFALDMWMLHTEDMYHFLRNTDNGAIWERHADSATRAIVGTTWLTCNHR